MNTLLDDLRSYSIEDFMPMGADIYLRLFERVNTALWPLHVLTLGAGIALIFLLMRRHDKFAWPLLGGMWMLVGLQFHGQFFIELNWAAIYFVWGFIVQGVLLSLLFFFAKSQSTLEQRGYIEWFGLLLVIFGVLFFPLLSFLFDRSWQSAEVVGVSPDPTCLVTLGALLQNRRMWWAALLPLFWCAISGAIAYALNLPNGFVLLYLGIFFVFLKILS